jgi:hypothetical protein
MLAGEGVVATWNGIAPEGRAEFYEWHIREHMPERLGIAGFRRGRRYRAADEITNPEFFTLYEVDTFQVLQSQDYANRLNAPTSWTKRATAHFRDTSRALARVIASHGSGPGGALLTLRFDVGEDECDGARRDLAALMPRVADIPQVTGAHFCQADHDASDARTTESRSRTDIQVPPRWFILVEACTMAALDSAEKTLRSQRHLERAEGGRYAIEFTRLRTQWAAG